MKWHGYVVIELAGSCHGIYPLSEELKNSRIIEGDKALVSVFHYKHVIDLLQCLWVTSDTG